MVKKFSEFVNEGWAASSIRRTEGDNRRQENYTVHPSTKEELRDIIIKRIEKNGRDYECDLNDIDVSRITDMSYLFNTYEYYIFDKFNGDLSGWDVSGVENMESMFRGCVEFNQNISKWDVSGVKNMSYMFSGCTKFNQDIGGWKVSGVKNMEHMFYKCEKFNQDLSRWDVSNVEDMDIMFYECTGFYEAEKLESWKDRLKEGVYILSTFYKCPVKPSWYK